LKVLALSATWRRTKVRILQGDITDQDVDAIVNAANSSLMGGGGVDGAIHRKGGPEILEACRRIRSSKWPGGLPPGKAVMTTGGRLRSRHVIHTVGPIWAGGHDREPEILSECYLNALSLAAEHGLASLAFPSISTGAFGYPIREASRIALKTVKGYVKAEGRPAEVVFVVFGEGDLGVYLEALRELG
jgi:O-acetyl-ADP-ribose deacetylase